LVVNSTGGWPVPPYIGDDNLSAWIGPNNAADLNGPAGDYQYTTTFSLNGFVPGSAMISGLWAADNQEVGIYLNGHQVVATNTGYLEPDGYYEQFTNWSPFTITSNYCLPGTNTLTFDVLNDPYNPPSLNDNPTALRVELTGTAEYATLSDAAVAPEPVSMIFFGTGLVAVGGYIARRRMARKA
jgi:hypothetical protein